MSFTLYPLNKYSKKEAKKKNKFTNFTGNNGRISIYPDEFNTELSGIVFAGTKKEYKKALKSKHAFIYNKKKGALYYNENGKTKKLGEGGIIAIFKKNISLSNKNFKFFTQGSKPESVNKNTDPSPEPGKSMGYIYNIWWPYSGSYYCCTV